jgi:hypothetical protein
LFSGFATCLTLAIVVDFRVCHPAFSLFLSFFTKEKLHTTITVATEDVALALPAARCDLVLLAASKCRREGGKKNCDDCCGLHFIRIKYE